MPSGKNPRRRIVHYDPEQRLFSLECGHFKVFAVWRLRHLGVPQHTIECKDCGDLARAQMPPCKSFWLARLGPFTVRATPDGYVQAEADIERHGRHKLNKWAHAWSPNRLAAEEDYRKGRVQWYVRCRCGGKVPLSVAS